MAFSRKPILDALIVKEIPVAEYFDNSGAVTVDLDNAHIRVKPDRGVVVAISDEVDQLLLDDIVFFDEFALNDPVYLNPADKWKTDLPKYWLIRVGDVKAYDAENRKKIEKPVKSAIAKHWES